MLLMKLMNRVNEDEKMDGSYLSSICKLVQRYEIMLARIHTF